MGMLSDETVLNEIRDYLIRQYQPLAIMHYGSRQRGDNRPNSDWDFYMVVPTNFDDFDEGESAKLCVEAEKGIRKHLNNQDLKVDVLFSFPANFIESCMEKDSHAFNAIHGTLLYPDQVSLLVSYLEQRSR